MRFKDLLTLYTEGRTLDAIVEACERIGVKITRVMLSRWRSGERLPPEDPKIIWALAEVCRREPRPLLLLADMERNPERYLLRATTLLQRLGDEYARLHSALSTFGANVGQIAAGSTIEAAINDEVARVWSTEFENMDQAQKLSDMFAEIQDFELYKNEQYSVLVSAHKLDGTNEEELENPLGSYAAQWAAAMWSNNWIHGLEAKRIIELAKLVGVHPATIWSAIVAAKAAEFHTNPSVLVGLTTSLGMSPLLAVPADHDRVAPSAPPKSSVPPQPEYVEPRNEVERKLQELFETYIGNNIGIHDNLYLRVRDPHRVALALDMAELRGLDIHPTVKHATTIAELAENTVLIPRTERAETPELDEVPF